MTETIDSNKSTPEKDNDGLKSDHNGIESKPSHHARRPMNAFLIFCKKYRTTVKKHYPNSENRAITKILGDWWANIDVSIKSSYVLLAHQNKKAFYAANPDFKWYKLPAPPLKTCSTRPSNSKSIIYQEEISNSSNESYDIKLKNNNNNHITKLNLNIEPSTSKQHSSDDKSIFTPGKLADVTQMGNLSSLMISNSQNLADNELDEVTTLNSKFEIDDEHILNQAQTSLTTSLKRPFKKRFFVEKYENEEIMKEIESSNENNFESSEDIKMSRLQNELLETTRHFKTFESSSPEKNCLYDYDNESNSISNQFHHNKNESPSNCDNYSYANSSPKSCIKSNDVIKGCTNGENNSKLRRNRKSESSLNGRSCKGKRYIEFMNNGGLLNTKRVKKDSNESKNSINDVTSFSNKPTPSDKQKYNPFIQHSLQNVSFTYDENEKISKSASKDRSETEDEVDKVENTPFVTPDFDLDSKLNDLPILNFEDFLQKKKENKKRKKNTKQRDQKSKITRNKNSNSIKNHSTNVNMVNKEPIDYTDLTRENRLQLAKEHKNMLTGSRKRKIGKNSITRINVDSSNPNDSIDNVDNGNAISECTNVIMSTSTPSTKPLDMSALNTLAAVATAALKSTILFDIDK